MRTPRAKGETSREESFGSAHRRMRSEGRTGAVELERDREAGAVYLNGVAVYARYADKTGGDALEALSDGAGVRVKDCEPEKVRMFRTYVRYLGDDAHLRAEPLDGARVELQRVEGVLVDGVKNLASATWRGESTTADRTFFPEGERTVLVPDLVSLDSYVSDEGLTGYAAGDGKVVTFRDGETVDGASVDLSEPVRSEVGAGGGWVVVDSEAEDTEQDEGEDDGILSRIF
jgi:hypothetical protein